VAGDGTLALFIPRDAMVTVSTIATAAKGVPSAPIPPDAPFPRSYRDDFGGYPEDHLPRYFADQAGSFAVRGGALVQVTPADPGPNAWSANREPYTLLGDANWTDVTAQVGVAFSAAPAGGAPASALPPRFTRGEGAGVAPCSAASTRWAFSAVAPGYLSTVAPAPLTCLNVPGCDAAQALIYWDCVTTGCTCGCPTFTNLQFALGPGGALTTPTAPAACVTLLPSGALALKPCTAGAGQVWSHSGSTGALSVVPPGGGAPVCLAGPPGPPPPQVWAGLTVRAPPYPNNGVRTYDGYTLRLMDSGAWEVLAERAVLGNGTLPAPFNSSQPHQLRLAAVGTALTAAVDGAQVWSGSDSTYSKGQTALGSGYHAAAFDDFSNEVTA
jgi:hypothetical protein